MKPVVLTILILGVAARVQAQPAPEPSGDVPLPSDDALAHVLDASGTTAEEAYRLGVRLFSASRFEAAEQAWLRAYSLRSDPALWVAVADARQRRGNEPGAVAMLERYLTERPDAPDRVAIEARIATLSKSPGRLVIRTAEPGRAILLDGRPLKPKTPAEIEVEPGSHTIVVVGEGNREGEQTVEVGYGELKQIDFAPEPALVVEPTEEAKLQSRLIEDREDRSVRRAVLATGTIAAATLTTGTLLRIFSNREEERFYDDPTGRTADKADRLATFSNLSFGLAALSAITSFTLFITHKNQRSRERRSARLRVDARGAGASATLRF